MLPSSTSQVTATNKYPLVTCHRPACMNWHVDTSSGDNVANGFDLLRWILADDRRTARATRLSLVAALIGLIFIVAVTFAVTMPGVGVVGGPLAVGATTVLLRRGRRWARQRR